MKKIPIKTKISKNLHWIEPYLKKAKHKMPSLKLPARIRSYQPTTTKKMRNVGACVINERLLTIATHTQVKIRKTTNKREIT